MDNFYEKLKADFPTFGATLRLDERQQKSLQDLLAYASGALASYRNEVTKSRADTDHSEEHKEEKLAGIRAKVVGAIEAEFGKVQKRVPKAQDVLYNATHKKPQDTTEELLHFMKSKEIREGLEKMSIAKRTEFLLEGAQAGDASVLRAAEAQPITSNLIPSDVLDRANKVYADRVAPEQSMLVDLAKVDLEGALMVRNLSTVEMGHIENG